MQKANLCQKLSLTCRGMLPETVGVFCWRETNCNLLICFPHLQTAICGQPVMMEHPVQVAIVNCIPLREKVKDQFSHPMKHHKLC